MDFGALVGFEGSSSVSPSDPDTNQKLYGSALCNTVTHQDDDDDDDDDCRKKRIGFKKMTKTSDDSSTTSSMRSNGGHVSDSQQMLCFSSPNSLPSSLPYYHSAYARNTPSDYGSSMYGIKGPFTPSQWMELEHQALIYKYITANAPVPSNLLIPIRKALESAAFSYFPGSHLRSNSLGWGGFHLGFSNTDPEPGRCRRTDGKKWRCSRDAVIDQKYCERHMNRGRHRSRKPVEGQSGQSSSASRPPTTTAASAASKVVPPSSAPPSVVPSSNSSNSLSLNNLQPLAPSSLNRGFMNNENGLKRDRFSIPKQQNLYEEQTSLSEFGLVSSNSLLNPFHKTFQDLNQETKSHHSLRQFMDQSDRTELSISIPMPSSDFMSSTSSPSNEKIISLSPLRLSSRENFDPTHMETDPKKQDNWIPISWENAMGGPLGEVLHSTNNSNSGGDYKGTSALNLMTEGWDSCPSIASSPTGVLQKSTYRSLSSSSAGSSPIITSLAQI